MGNQAPTSIMVGVGAQPTKYLVASEAGLERTDLSAKAWLNTCPRGAYTTMRTVNKTRVYLLSFHLQRLATSARSIMMNDVCEHNKATVIDTSTIQPRFLSVIQAGLRAYQESGVHCAGSKEARLTVLVYWEQESFKIAAHISPLGKPPICPVTIKVVSAVRTNAQVKDSSWVRERAALESQQTEDIEELIMCDPVQGHLLEGLSSNFFVYINKHIQTAEKEVLQGSVRAAAIQAAAHLNIPVSLTAPNLNESNQWQGAFLTSTSRLLLPVKKIIGLTALGYSDVEFESIPPAIHQLKLMVEEDIERNSEPIN